MGDQVSGSHTTKYVLLFAAGTAIGSAIAFGAAYGLATHYAKQLDGEEAVVKQKFSG
jgi:hypothetical protein